MIKVYNKYIFIHWTLEASRSFVSSTNVVEATTTTTTTTKNNISNLGIGYYVRYFVQVGMCRGGDKLLLNYFYQYINNN